MVEVKVEVGGGMEAGAMGEGGGRWWVTRSEAETVWSKGVPLTITPPPEKH